MGRECPEEASERRFLRALSLTQSITAMSVQADAEKYHPDLMAAIAEVQDLSDCDAHTIEDATPETLDVKFKGFSTRSAFLHVEREGADNDLPRDFAIVEVRIDETTHDHHTVAGALARITAYFTRQKWATV